MGYSERIKGEITFSPPLVWSEVRQSPLYLKKGQLHTSRPVSDPDYFTHNIKIGLTEDVFENEEGKTIRYFASVLTPTDPDSEYARSDRLVESLELFIKHHGEGREFKGFIEAQGEAQGDVRRYLIKDGAAVQKEAQIVWDFDELVKQRDEAFVLLDLVLNDLGPGHSCVGRSGANPCAICAAENFLHEPRVGELDDKSARY